MKKLLFGLVLIIICFSGTSCMIYETGGPAYTPVNTAPAYYTLRVFDNRYVFYDTYNEPVALWIFRPDGVCVKQGIVISGPVRMYYQPDVLFCETYYNNGFRDGMCRYYYPSGAIMYSGYYSRGYLSGGWNAYAATGGISASFNFHGTETQMPATFAPPPAEARVGFSASMRECSYTGNKVVVQASFNKTKAVPSHFRAGFGVQAGAAVPRNAGFTAAAQGHAPAQPAVNQPGIGKPASNNPQPGFGQPQNNGQPGMGGPQNQAIQPQPNNPQGMNAAQNPQPQKQGRGWNKNKKMNSFKIPGVKKQNNNGVGGGKNKGPKKIKNPPPENNGIGGNGQQKDTGDQNKPKQMF